MTPNWVDRAHWPTNKNTQHLYMFVVDVSGPWKNSLKWLQMGQDDCFPTNPDLADILGRNDSFFCFFVDCLEPNILDFQDPKNQDFQKSGLGQAWAELGRAWVRGGILGPSLTQARFLEILIFWVLEIQNVGFQTINKKTKKRIISAKNVSKVWISRETIILAHLEPFQAIFPWTGNINNKHI
jgi:hypothetical protein